MRLYLDTNILVFFLFRQDELSLATKNLLFDYSNTLYTSTICVHELIHLYQIGKIEPWRRTEKSEGNKLLEALNDACIKIVSVSEIHLREYSELPFHGRHRDPDDRLIISQSIADHIPLISSDGHFGDYVKDGLDFIYNER